MEPNFEHIKRSFDESPPSLPPELNWEQMEKGILQKMDALEAEEPKRKPFLVWFTGKRSLLVVILILLGVATMLALYTGRPYPSQPSTAQQDSLDREGAKQKAKSDVSNKEKTEFAPANVDTESNGTANTQVFSSHAPNHPKVNNSYPGKESLPVFTPPFTATASKEMQQVDTHKRTREPLEVIKPVSSAVRTEREEDLGSPSTTHISKLNHLATPSILPIDSLYVSGFTPIEAVDAGTFPHAFRQQSRLIASAGGNIWRPGLWGPQPERFAYEAPIVSYQFQLSYLRPLKQKWVLAVGIQYQQLESRFERIFDIEDYEVLLTDVVIRRENNLITGRVREQRGDVTVQVPAKRSIVNFNSMELYQAQVAVGRTWTTTRLQTDILIGGRVNLHTQNQGRTLYQGELQFYQGAVTDFLANQGKFAALISGRLTYRLSRRWGLVSSLQFQQSLFNWSLEPRVGLYPTVMGMEVGLSYRL